MIKKIVKNLPGYSYLKSKKEEKRLKEELQEAYKRAEDHSFMKDCDEEEKANWRKRIDDVLACADNAKMEFHEHAGTLQGDYMIMHNGLKILPLSYYGWPVLQMLHETKGIHEPQEEYVFQEVLKHMPEGAVMIELGAYWSFYSMWFNKDIKKAKNYMLETMDA